MHDNAKARLDAAIREACITDEPHRLIVKAAAVMDICELWRQLSFLDAPILHPGDRSNAEYLANPRNIHHAERERAAIIELSKLRTLSPYPCFYERELQELLERLDMDLLLEIQAAQRRAQMLDDSNETERQSQQQKPQGPRSPAGRRREHLVPVALELRKHGWSDQDIVALVIGEVHRPVDDRKDLWLSPPCPETRDFWTDFGGEIVPDLIKQLRKDIRGA